MVKLKTYDERENRNRQEINICNFENKDESLKLKKYLRKSYET